MLAKFNREHGHDEDEVRFITRTGVIPPSLLTFPATSIRPQGVKPIHIAIKKLPRFCSGCHLRWFSFQTVTPELDGVQPAYGHCCACVQRIFRRARANTD